MTTKTLPQGSRKLIVPNANAAARNQGRALAGAKSLLPVYVVLVLNDAGEVSECHSANLEPFTATLRETPTGLHKLIPSTAAALRAITDERMYFFAETTEALALDIP